MGNYTFAKLALGKLHIWEVGTWEIVTWKVALGKRFLGNYLTPFYVTLTLLAVRDGDPPIEELSELRFIGLNLILTECSIDRSV